MIRGCVIALLLTAGTGMAEVSLPFFRGGIQVNEPDHEQWVQQLKARGLNTVSVTVYAKQGNWNSDHLWFEEEEPAVLSEIRAARAAGLHVVLIPRVAMDHAYPANDGLWHGMIMPSSDDELRSWFAIYQRFLLQWASVAAEEGIDLMAVGSELKSLTRTVEQSLPELAQERTDFFYWYDGLPDRVDLAISTEPDQIERYRSEMEARARAYQHWGRVHWGNGEAGLRRLVERRRLLRDLWKETIARVREIYPGPLAYSANFDNYDRVGFWADLDVMGINAYFQLRTSLSEPTADQLRGELESGWRKVFAEMERVRKHLGAGDLPVIFTEVGYSGRRYATVEPWSYGGLSLVEEGEQLHLVDWARLPRDRRERTAALEALDSVAKEEESAAFRGLLYWKLSTIPSHTDIEPFVIQIGPESDDPALVPLRRMGRRTDPAG